MERYSPKNNGNIEVSQKEKLANRFGSIFLVLCLIISLFICGISVIYTTAQVNGTSMQPNINASYSAETPYSDIAYCINGTYRNGDIITVKLPQEECGDHNGIKRLIASGGDTLFFYNNRIYVNGTILKEDYLKNYEVNATAQEKFKNYCIAHIEQDNITHNELTGVYILTIPENYVYYMGDNREVSLDCTNFGPQPEETVLSKVAFVVPYGQNVYQFIWSKFCELFY